MSGTSKPPRRNKDSRAERDPKTEDRIGENSRAYYDQVVSEPVPDKLRALIDELARREAEQGE